MHPPPSPSPLISARLPFPQSELELLQDEALAEQAKAQQQRVTRFWEEHWLVGSLHHPPITILSYLQQWCP